MRRGASWIRVIITLAGLTAAVFFSLRGDGRDGYWARHPMLGALISGVILFAAGALVVNRWIAYRNARRWAAAAVTANRDLGTRVDESLVALWAAHSDPDPGDDERDSDVWTPAWRARDSASARDVADDRRQFTVAEDLPAADYARAALTPEPRLQELLEDPEYSGFARDLVDRHRDAIRDAIQGWAGLMMWDARSQDLLKALALYCEEHLSRVGYHLHCDRNSSEGDPEKIVAQWALADLKGRVLMNTFWGENTRYRFVLPPEARGASLRAAFREQDAVGRWRPSAQGHLSRPRYAARHVRWLWRWLLAE